MNERFRLALVLSILGLCVFIAPYAQAEVRPGIRGGAYANAESGALGGELLTGIGDQWYFNPNVEFVFVDNATMLTFNFDVHYDLTTSAPVYFWVGTGPAILYRNSDGPGNGRTDLGANLFFGVGFNKGGRITPYIQPKVILSRDSEFALTAGVRF